MSQGMTWYKAWEQRQHRARARVTGVLEVVMAAAGMLGAVLNVAQMWECFVVWMLANAAGFGFAWRTRRWCLAVLFSVYFVLCIWGIHCWRSGFQVHPRF